jgi:small subunit ribosomal protein S8
LKYDKDTKESVIRDIQRISKPGLRKYSSSSTIPRILNGLGIAIVSTSKGLMTGKKAKQLNVGGSNLLRILINRR